MRVAAIVLASLVLGFAAAPAVHAQVGGPQVPGPLNPPPPPPPPPTESFDDGGMSTLQIVLIFGGAVAVLGGIAWFIVRDAHRAAPVQERAHTAVAAGTPKSRERQRQQERARRAKAKAAKNQRRRNRR